MSIEATISDYYNSLASMNPQGWLNTLAENATIYDPVGKPPLNPQEDSQKLFTILTTFYSKFDILKESLFVVNNEAAVKWKMTVISKNGKEATAEGITTFKLNEAGKITQVKAYWDENQLKSQLM
ncbi:nuclear transport factor 2 family protein [Crocosphaera sp. UHCC 0190]|uniref:nuclear transport factor 2 family protein n=1 Tax=Crocosphaera sp. UHCC 0190 TaxID=3110246 RepID=UPI002B21751A|nr:nuclear transport factor 2 family protein [Crocosphaera sp. UHCC 0190]MEA5508436.1 nuclear transport factor 2 family protein [Crocosphaera sp. UHCC 0190]